MLISQFNLALCWKPDEPRLERSMLDSSVKKIERLLLSLSKALPVSKFESVCFYAQELTDSVAFYPCMSSVDGKRGMKPGIMSPPFGQMFFAAGRVLTEDEALEIIKEFFITGKKCPEFQFYP